MLKKFKLQVLKNLPKRDEMTEGIIYFSDKHQRSAHLCACSCGEKILLSHYRGGWRHYIDTDGEITISTQIRNENCKTYYIIREGYAFRGTY